MLFEVNFETKYAPKLKNANPDIKKKKIKNYYPIEASKNLEQ